MRIPFSGYNKVASDETTLKRICEPGLDGRVFWMKGIIINNEGASDHIVKIYDEAEAATATPAKQRLPITAKANATTVVDFPAPGIKFVDDVGAVSHADIKAYGIAVTGYLE
ncbi:hypothetical protein ES703_49053 [subsurface metagenome]